MLCVLQLIESFPVLGVLMLSSERFPAGRLGGSLSGVCVSFVNTPVFLSLSTGRPLLIVLKVVLIYFFSMA